VSDESGRGGGGLWSRFGGRRPPGHPGGRLDEVPGAPPPQDQPTKALRKFLSTLAQHEAPVLLDLGPVVGSNLNFFGETLGCKVFIEDIYADVERHLRAGTAHELPAFFERRFTQGDASVDGILAWDLIDYLDLPAAQALAGQLLRLLRVEGALLGFFAASTPRPDAPPYYTKYIVADEGTLKHRFYAASRGRQRVLQNRDIIRLFDGARVSDSFLLQSNVREILFRKPSYLSAPRPPR
jgi:hypothetical protein